MSPLPPSNRIAPWNHPISLRSSLFPYVFISFSVQCDLFLSFRRIIFLRFSRLRTETIASRKAYYGCRMGETALALTCKLSLLLLLVVACLTSLQMKGNCIHGLIPLNKQRGSHLVLLVFRASLLAIMVLVIFFIEAQFFLMLNQFFRCV